jgi:ketosteroid isomerase-like protein
MKRTPLAVVICAATLVGCAPIPHRGAPSRNDRAEVKQRLGEIFDAAEKKQFTRLESFHLYGPQFSKFAAEEFGRQDARAARRGEHDGLSAINELSMRADDLKIDLFGDVAIATFIMNYSFKTGANTKISKRARSTMVFVKQHGAWKIAHEHFSELAKTAPR